MILFKCRLKSLSNGKSQCLNIEHISRNMVLMLRFVARQTQSSRNPSVQNLFVSMETTTTFVVCHLLSFYLN